MSNPQADFLQGTMDLLILKVLSQGPEHGWGVARRLQQISHDVLTVNEGSLYPALHRLALKGWIEASWGKTENNRRAKYYRLTPLGEAELQEESREWRRFAVAVELVLQLG